jgi:aryl-phospho-beta-D-glucosidase BglC (GH1 family)
MPFLFLALLMLLGFLRTTYFVAVVLVVTLLLTNLAAAQVPPSRHAVLARGININKWFTDPYVKPLDYYAHYVSPALLNQIKSAGFTYIRIPLSPFALQQPDGSLNVNVAKALVQQIASIQSMGLGVSISPERQKWQLQDNAHDRELVAQFWDQLAPLLASLNPDLTFPEILNEPNFPNGSDWDTLQFHLFQIIRGHLPNITILATGNHWDDVTNLPKVKLLPDRNIIYMFHFYDPGFLTSTEAKDVPAQDLPAMSALIFPVDDPAFCTDTSRLAQTPNTQGQIKWYCKSGWTVAKIRASIHAVAEWARQNGVVAADEEFGILDNRSRQTRLAYLRAVREACEAEGMGWGLWAYNDGFGFSISLEKPGLQPLDPDILQALGLH